MRGTIKTLTAAILLCGTALAASPAYERAQALRVEAEAAMASGDYAAAEAALETALTMRANHPGIMLALAAAEARLGKTEDSLDHLEQFVGMGLAANLGTDEAFSSLLGEPRFTGVLSRIERNLSPVGAVTTAVTLGDGAALFEGMAIDARNGHLFASSVRRNKIIVVEDGKPRDFSPADSGLWSVFGLAIDYRNDLVWAASSAGPQTEGATPETYGAAGVFAFDLQTGALKRKAVLPPDGQAAFGDVAVAPDGTVYVSDSANGRFYRLAPGAEALEPFAVDERWVSPQGMTVVADGAVLIVADYAMGLYAIDTATQRISPIAVPSGTTVLGIDGLSGKGPLIMATQNGVNPQRVLRLALGEDWTRLRQVAVMAANVPQHREITLGDVVGDNFYYIANSQWDRFAEDGAQANDEPFMETVVVKVAVQ